MIRRRIEVSDARNAAAWHTVTVVGRQQDLEEQAGGALAALRAVAEVVIRDAAGGRGTEVAVRPLQGGETGPDAHGELRAALRDFKQLVETGEVLRADAPPTTRWTALNRPLEYATTHGRQGGRL